MESKLETCKSEFGRFMRMLVMDSRFFAYYDDAKGFMRLLVQCAPTAAMRPLWQQEWEPIVSKAGYMLAKISFDRRQVLKDAVPDCFRAVAYQQGDQDNRYSILMQMIAVAKELLEEEKPKGAR